VHPVHAADPSPWVTRFAPKLAPGGEVLDVACGGGRHARLFLDRGHLVRAVDRDLGRIADLGARPQLRAVEADLEDGSPFPFRGEQFAAVVVTNYLFRPIMRDLVACVASGGWFLYETFAAGNERYGRPTNPDFLLRPGELLEAVRGKLRVIAYEDVVVEAPRPAAVQRIAATRDHE
jgi:SAM-dependent methyltransferase